MIDRENIKNDYREFCDFLSNKNYSEEFYSYLNNDELSIDYFSNYSYDNKSEQWLCDKYINELKMVSSSLGNDNFSDDQKLLNYLEYFRLNCMYHNFKGINDKISIENEPAYNAALLGKGTCISQTKYFLDLLNNTNFTNYKDFKIEIIRKHYYITFTYNNNTYTIDPSVYNGMSRSLERTIVGNNEIIYDKNMILESRNKALDFSISKNKITKVKDNSNTIIEKLLNYCTYDNYLSIGSVITNDKHFEIGKVLEMLCYLNGLSYEISCNDDKRNSVYSIVENGTYNIINVKDQYKKKKIEVKFDTKKY